jgi:hypothetical protein
LLAAGLFLPWSISSLPVAAAVAQRLVAVAVVVVF